MKRDLLVIGVGMLAVGVVTWSFWGNPRGTPRMHTVQMLDKDPNVKLVSEHSPFMRTER
jgi:hypothetical protein